MADANHRTPSDHPPVTAASSAVRLPGAVGNRDAGPVAAGNESSATPSKAEGAQGPGPEGTSPDATPAVGPTEVETGVSTPEATHGSSPADAPGVGDAPSGLYQSADDYPSGPFYPAPRTGTPGRPAGD